VAEFHEVINLINAKVNFVLSRARFVPLNYSKQSAMTALQSTRDIVGHCAEKPKVMH